MGLRVCARDRVGIRTYRQSAEKRERHEEGVQAHETRILASHVRIVEVMSAIRRWCRFVPLKNECLVDLGQRRVVAMTMLMTAVSSSEKYR